jgi:pimeloyl-ACP methyl ester carboxylesterase
MHRSTETKPDRTLLIKDEALLTDLDKPLQGIAEGVLVVQNQSTIDRLRTWQPYIPSFALDDMNFGSRLQSLFSFDVDKLPKPCDKPTLILSARQDHIVGFRDPWHIIENFPHATFAVVDQAGHAIAALEQFKLCQALLNDWLDRVEKSARA